jgi:phosphate transport system substrate-binding protein
MPTTLPRRAAILSALLLGTLGAVTGCSGCSRGGPVTLNGGGATFIMPIMTEWADTYKDLKPVQISYQSIGSGGGIAQLTAKTVDFGCSEAPMNAEQLAKAKEAGGDVIHIPLVLGAVVPAYNLPEVTQPLNFDGKLLADIYLGKIKKWNDPAIAALNPGAPLPDLAIAVVARAENSGTSAVFSEYLSKVNPEFKEKVGTNTLPTWPREVQKEKGNEGMTAFVKASHGAIGYLELSYAEQQKIPHGAVRNKAGKLVRATLEGITAAATAALGEKQTDPPYTLHELTFSLTNAEGEASYPISGISYGLLFKKQPKGKGEVLVAFLRWAVTDGQQQSPKLYYAPLPPALVEKIQARLNQVEYAP